MNKIAVNDISIAYELIGSGEPLVLLHGATGDASTFNSLIPSLAKHYQLLLFDQRGSGETDKPDMEYSMELLAQDTASLMEQLGIKSSHIFGVSLGGMVAQALAIGYPQKVRSLILGCTLPGGWRHAIKQEPPADLATAFSTDETISAERRAKALANVAFAPGYIQKHPELIAQLIKEREARPIDKVGLTHRLAITERYDAFDDLAKISCPTLIMTGKHDQLLASDNSKIIAQQIKDSELIIFENAGHSFWVEKTEFVQEKIIAFLMINGA